MQTPYGKLQLQKGPYRHKIENSEITQKKLTVQYTRGKKYVMKGKQRHKWYGKQICKIIYKLKGSQQMGYACTHFFLSYNKAQNSSKINIKPRRFHFVFIFPQILTQKFLILFAINTQIVISALYVLKVRNYFVVQITSAVIDFI